MAEAAAEAKLDDVQPGVEAEDSVNVVRYEYLSESDDDGFEYEEVPESEDDADDFALGLQGEETLAEIERNVLKQGKSTRASAKATISLNEEKEQEKDHEQESDSAGRDVVESKTVVRPAVVDDFFRGFLMKLNMSRTLDQFNTEWYELSSKGKLSDEQVGAVPDIYLRNQELDETVQELRGELEHMRTIASNAQSTWDKFRKERDFHRLHHKRVVQEKNKLIGEIKRMKKHYQTYEPMIKQLRQKYELAMKEKMLMKIERDKQATRSEALEQQLQAIERAEDTESDGRTRRSSVGRPQGRASLSGKGSSSTSSASRINKLATRDTRSKKGGTTATSHPTSGIPDVDPPNPFSRSTFEVPQVKAAQMVKTFEGHMNAISAVEYHPRKQVIATASDDHTWKLWSVPNGDLIMSGEGHQDWVSGLAFNPRGTHLLSCAGDGTVKLWDFEKAKCAATMTDHAQPVWDVAWHYSGNFFVSSSMDHTAKLWDMEHLKVRQTFRGHVDSVNAVSFQPFSSSVCTASGDKTVSMWDSRSGLCVQTFFGHNNACNSLSLNLRGDTIASCDADGIVKLWDVRMVKELFTIEGGTHSLNDIKFDRSGAVLAAASDDGSIKMLDALTGKSIVQLRGHDDAVQGVAFDPESRFFVSAASDKTFRVWKL